MPWVRPEPNLCARSTCLGPTHDEYELNLPLPQVHEHAPCLERTGSATAFICTFICTLWGANQSHSLMPYRKRLRACTRSHAWPFSCRLYCRTKRLCVLRGTLHHGRAQAGLMGRYGRMTNGARWTHTRIP
jgi:hypothetical protein